MCMMLIRLLLLILDKVNCLDGYLGEEIYMENGEDIDSIGKFAV